MLKISKLTDYGLLASVYLVRRKGEVVSSREIAEFYHLPVPMITKVLKTLQQGGFVRSHRGVGGGYSFDDDPEVITLGQLLEVLEGPWDLVECESTDDRGHAVCSIRVACPSRRFMFGINRAIKGAFENVSLADLVRGALPVVSVHPDASRREAEGSPEQHRLTVQRSSGVAVPPLTPRSARG